MNVIYLIVLGYFIGNILFGLIIAKFLYNQDIQRGGSGNPGARNAGRLFGKKAFVLTFLGDAGKAGLLITFIKQLDVTVTVQLLVWLAVIVGHVYPLTLRFKGGKGMSAFIGGILAFNVLLFSLFAVVILILFLLIRSTILAGMTAVALLPILMLFFSYQPIDILLGVIIAGVVIFAHRINIKEKILLGMRKGGR